MFIFAKNNKKMKKNEYLKRCPECEDMFEATRLNQKFCGSECKTRYNNRNTMSEYHERKQEDVITRNVNKILYQNREILKHYAGQEVTLENLEKQGFKNKYITTFVQVEESTKMVFFCYDMAYQFINEEKLVVLPTKQK